MTGDSHKNTEVRRAMQPLVDLADACNCAVLGITHFSKGGQGSDPAQRVVGSVAFTAVARVVLVAAKVKDEQGEDARILARGKSNIGPDDVGFAYHMDQCEPMPGIQTGMDGGWEWALPAAEESGKGAKGARSENTHSSHSSALPSVPSDRSAPSSREVL